MEWVFVLSMFIPKSSNDLFKFGLDFPFISINDSGGARIQEGINSLVDELLKINE